MAATEDAAERRFAGSGLEPAALGGNKDGLGAVDCTELAVRVVEVRAHRARREAELESDLLVDLALREALEHLDLSVRERARLDLPGRSAAGVGKLVHHAADLVRRHAEGLADLDHLVRVDRVALA